MKNINENINRLRQIMSYDRSRGLLVNESQYSIEDSIELEEQEETVSGVEAIANKIYKASKGMGTDETSFISAVKDIKSKEEFNQVDELLKSTDFGNETQGFEYFVSDELGNGSTEETEVLSHLKTIGVELSGYTEENEEEVSSDPFDIEKIKSGEQFLKKGQGNEASDTVTSVQELLISKMDTIGVTIDFEQSDLGNYGPKTAALVTAFQSMNNLKPDGIVGAKTLTALMG
jgi:peptidoglycan hydrolase-like protein with peptidoglycan-binding domain